MNPIILATVPAIVALVNLAKGLGLPTRYASVLAVLLGIGLAVADQALGALPAYQAASSGLLLGLGAVGLYDLIPAGGAAATIEYAPERAADGGDE